MIGSYNHIIFLIIPDYSLLSIIYYSSYTYTCMYIYIRHYCHYKIFVLLLSLSVLFLSLVSDDVSSFITAVKTLYSRLWAHDEGRKAGRPRWVDWQIDMDRERIVPTSYKLLCKPITYLVGGLGHPLKNMSSSIGMMTETQYMGK